MLALLSLTGLSIVVTITNLILFISLTVRNRKSGLIHLDIVFLTFFSIYAFVFPISNYFSPKLDWNKEVVESAYLICQLSNFGYAIGLLFTAHKQYKIEKNQTFTSFQMNANLIRLYGYLVVAAGVMFSFAIVLATVGIQSYITAGYAGRALIKRQAGPVELGLYFSVVGLVMIFTAHIATSKKKFKDSLFLFSTALLFVGYVSFLGIRRPTFLLLLALISVYSILKHRPKPFLAFVGGVPVFLLLTTFAQYRQVLGSSGLRGTVEFIQENYSVEWFDFSRTELGAPFKTLYYTLSDSMGVQFYYGWSYLSSVFYVLPSALNGGMKSLSVKYTHAYFSEDFISIGGNMGYFPATEAFVNFGYLGPIFVFCVIAIFLSHINYKMHKQKNRDFFITILFALAVPWLAFLIRLDFASFLKGFLYSQLIPLIGARFLYFIHVNRIKKYHAR